MTTTRQEHRSDNATHLHEEVRVRVLEQRAGVPYEVSMRVCAECKQVLDEQAVKRAAA